MELLDKTTNSANVTAQGRFDPSIMQLGHCFDLRESENAAEFLRKDSSVIPILLEGYSVITQPDLFPTAKLGLTVYSDPEDGTEQLIIIIPTKYSPQDALLRYEQLKRDWWSKTLRRYHGKLGIKLEFV